MIPSCQNKCIEQQHAHHPFTHQKNKLAQAAQIFLVRTSQWGAQAPWYARYQIRLHGLAKGRLGCVLEPPNFKLLWKSYYQGLAKGRLGSVNWNH
eukprot:1159441-Pelagomonas_calceolata.AAC.8